MRVRVNLMGALKAKTPDGGQLELAEDANIDDVLQLLDIPLTHVQVVMVNGNPQHDRSLSLSENDELTVLAPVGGG